MGEGRGIRAALAGALLLAAPAALAGPSPDLGTTLGSCATAFTATDEVAARIGGSGWAPLGAERAEAAARAVALFELLRNLAYVPGPVRAPADVWQRRWALALADGRALARRRAGAPAAEGAMIWQDPTGGSLLLTRTLPGRPALLQCTLIADAPMAARLRAFLPPDLPAAPRGAPAEAIVLRATDPGDGAIRRGRVFLIDPDALGALTGARLAAVMIFDTELLFQPAKG
ncbi:MAG: hypothetical protein D6832_00180 [Alphaproteobacteria bacterium]|nr:MAG: hypothetical protein D6832_00180 [Alphaproteobacteria bacterium]